MSSRLRRRRAADQDTRTDSRLGRRRVRRARVERPGRAVVCHRRARRRSRTRARKTAPRPPGRRDSSGGDLSASRAPACDGKNVRALNRRSWCRLSAAIRPRRLQSEVRRRAILAQSGRRSRVGAVLTSLEQQASSPVVRIAIMDKASVGRRDARSRARRRARARRAPVTRRAPRSPRRRGARWRVEVGSATRAGSDRLGSPQSGRENCAGNRPLARGRRGVAPLSSASNR